MIAIVQLLAIFIVPVLILKYHRFILTRWLGTIGTAYALGIIVALLVFGMNKIGINFALNTDIGEIGSHVAISIAIPLLLFSANLKEAKKLSSTVLKSFLSLVISAIIVSVIAFYFYATSIEFGAELSGMAIGLYTGGTPNLNAIGNIFGLDATTIGVANLSDMMIGAVFYMFLLLACKPLLKTFLKKPSGEMYLKEESNIENTDLIRLDHLQDVGKLTRRVLLALMMAVIGALIGLVVWLLLGAEDGRMNDFLVPIMMISVTLFGIAGSFNKQIRETKGMNVLGQYFILVFSFALASSLDFSRMQGLFVNILVLYSIITVGVFIIHSIIAKFLKIDTDCTMVILTAGLYGPAFVPAITKQIGNDALTIPGLITGSIGYALGTFLGSGLIFIFLL